MQNKSNRFKRLMIICTVPNSNLLTASTQNARLPVSLANVSFLSSSKIISGLSRLATFTQASFSWQKSINLLQLKFKAQNAFLKYNMHVFFILDKHRRDRGASLKVVGPTSDSKWGRRGEGGWGG